MRSTDLQPDNWAGQSHAARRLTISWFAMLRVSHMLFGFSRNTGIFYPFCSRELDEWAKEMLFWSWFLFCFVFHGGHTRVKVSIRGHYKFFPWCVSALTKALQKKKNFRVSVSITWPPRCPEKLFTSVHNGVITFLGFIFPFAIWNLAKLVSHIFKTDKLFKTN